MVTLMFSFMVHCLFLHCQPVTHGVNLLTAPLCYRWRAECGETVYDVIVPSGTSRSWIYWWSG